jgi:hypothetical protein
MLALTILSSTLLPASSNAHEQQPAFEKHWSGPVYVKQYTVTNYKVSNAVYKWTVLEKDYSLAEGWKVNKAYSKTGPGASDTVTFKFKVDDERKLLVCSTLVEINNEIPDITSSVCSRLWLKRIR